MRVLFVIPHPEEGASGRHRVFQYLPWLKRQGIDYEVRPFMSQALYRVLYQPGRLPHKVTMSVAAVLKRLADIVRSARADVVVVHREALPLGTALVERAMARMGPAVIFDFDDAIYLHHASHANSWTRIFRNANKTAAIVALSDHVIVGNRMLEAYARRYNSRVSVIPTPVDTARFCPRSRQSDPARVVIGWIGSHTTAAYLSAIQTVLATVAQRYPQVDIRVVGAGRLPFELPRLTTVPWSLERELDELHQFDIGLMPMPDDEWARGKCGFKALLYMSVGIPVVASAVGVNCDIIRDGVNGFLATSHQAWVARLAQLVEDRLLRANLGQAGRAIVEQDYSLTVHAPRFLQVLQNAQCNGRHLQ